MESQSMVHVRLPNELKKEIQHLAIDLQITMNEAVRQAIEKFIKQHK